jgi:hypothetical protein
MLTKVALETLGLLESGARFNCLSVVSRELIEAGLAFDGWGYLEITESGRRVLRRQYRNFAIDDPNISNMGEVNSAMSTPDNSHPLQPAEIATPGAFGIDRSSNSVWKTPEPDAADQIDRNKPTLQPAIEMAGVAWSRGRAIAAAGIANGVCGVWVDQKWIQAFLLAYEDAD